LESTWLTEIYQTINSVIVDKKRVNEENMDKDSDGER
jgi:hypothetical protein